MRSAVLRARRRAVSGARGTRLLAWAVVPSLAVAAGITAAGALSASPAAAATATLTVGARTVGPPVSAGFVGLATEFWDVQKEVGTNPAAPDLPFERVLGKLAPYGGLSLRIGGDSTDWTWFPIPGMKQPPWVRWTMTPDWLAVTRRLVADLRARLIVGVNMEANSARIASAELQALEAGIHAAAPLTFELGNEPELYSHFPFYHNQAGVAVLGRPQGYSYSQIAAQWNQLARALPQVRLAGPGYSGLDALPYVSQFLSSSPRLSLLTVHTYPLKAERCTGGHGLLQEGQLFASSSLAGLARQLGSWTSLARSHRVAVRVDEMNSVTCGGSPTFSKTLGPALWALNILPLYAADGVSGVNFQTRPYTAQNLIQTSQTKSGAWLVQVQPEYYGLMAFARLTPPGSRILSVGKLPAGLLGWAVRTPQGTTHVVVTNVGTAASSVQVRVAGASGPAGVESLRAGAGGLEATGGVTLAGQSLSPATGAFTGTPVSATLNPVAGAYDLTVPAASASILTAR